ncbi:(2Fe-2S)-binding protein [Alicyclobacillus tolerans]|uniref:putative iron-sulfur cluster-binding metallochaperone n=1 Tax=Alicyclobacillus tolerans TaxID=90970 RepID=UPI001F34A6D7|nr:(2Fe-2S)-binding protein [Alicyclobacillus tolerans]MCF8564595.1 (2Fe-2S)-binding protein [Alicyclobacillus tolerans]
MEDCCRVPAQKTQADSLICPVCQQTGKSVPLITLKALLTPSALSTLDPSYSYSFCPNTACEVVYFSHEQVFHKDAIKVPVYQKDEGSEVPVCYCFGWTRQKLVQAIQGKEDPTQYISEQVKANRCGCEVNNPQGSCCLGNVTAFVHSLEHRNG